MPTSKKAKVRIMDGEKMWVRGSCLREVDTSRSDERISRNLLPWFASNSPVGGFYLLTSGRLHDHHRRLNVLLLQLYKLLRL